MVCSIVDALRDVRGLEVQQHIDLGGFPVETVLFVADRLDRLAGCRLELGRIDDFLAVLVELDQRWRDPNLTGNDNAVGGRQGFASNAHAPWINTGFLRFTVNQIYNLVRDPVTHLVGVAFRNRFTGEKKSRALHGRLHRFEVLKPL